jgi:hypothetical protein
MDNQKDEQNNNQENQRPIAGMTVFDSRAHFAFVHKKTEKLVAAIYVVSNFIKDNEPLKWSIREKSLELLELATLLNFVSLDERKALLRNHQSVASEIISISGVARTSGLFSEMNHDIIKREFEALLRTIDESEKKQESSVFPPDFFETKSLLERSANSNVSYDQRADGMSFINHRKIQKDKNISTNSNQARKTIRQEISNQENIKDKNRKTIIIDMLKKKGGLGIKDFVGIVPGVSAKTIQRELLSLVAEGHIRKEGDRRWSRYFIA